MFFIRTHQVVFLWKIIKYYANHYIMNETIENKVKFALACGCIIALTSFGARSMMGLFVVPLADEHGGRAIVGLAMALQNLVWGFAQPLCGAIADRFGVGRVFVGGSLFYGLSLILIANATSGTQLLLGGIIMGLGIAGTSFSMVMISLGRMVAPERKAWAMGLGTASGSMGQFVFAPLALILTTQFDWRTALMIMGVGMLIVIPLAYPIRGKSTPEQGEKVMAMGVALKLAFAHRSYQLLIIGFFVCGFHLAFITTHLPAFLSDNNMPQWLTGWVLALIGLFNVIGSYMVGTLAQKYHNPYILAMNYSLRSLLFLLYVFIIPISVVSSIIFAMLLGLLWLSTVPPTAMSVNKMFGSKYMNTLYGFVFVSHQIGSFIGVYAGGLLYDTYKNYDYMWIAGIIIGFLSAAIHLPIKTHRAPAFQQL